MGIATITCPGRIGTVFTGTGDRHLDQHGSDWSQNHHRNHCQRITIFIITTTTEDHCPLGHVSHKADRPGDGCSNRTDQNIAILYVCHLMSHHPLELFTRENLGNPLSCSNYSMLWITAGCKSVGVGLGQHKNLRHDQTVLLADLRNDIIKEATSGLFPFVHFDNNFI